MLLGESSGAQCLAVLPCLDESQWIRIQLMNKTQLFWTAHPWTEPVWVFLIGCQLWMFAPPSARRDYKEHECGGGKESHGKPVCSSGCYETGASLGCTHLPQPLLGREVSSNLCCSKQKVAANIFGQSSSLPDLCLLLILRPRNFSATHVTNCKAR